MIAWKTTRLTSRLPACPINGTVMPFKELRIPEIEQVCGDHSSILDTLSLRYFEIYE